jgi:hypothetical protein
VKHTARSELLLEGGILRVELLLRFLFGIQVIEVAEELVEPMYRRKEFVTVTQVILSELSAGIGARLQQLGKRRVFVT